MSQMNIASAKLQGQAEGMTGFWQRTYPNKILLAKQRSHNPKLAAELKVFCGDLSTRLSEEGLGVQVIVWPGLSQQNSDLELLNVCPWQPWQTAVSYTHTHFKEAGSG